jgi:hypothetical protein
MLFNVFVPGNPMENTTSTGVYLGWDDVAATARKLGIPTVKLIERTTWTWKDKACLKEYAKGEYDSGKPREGVVIRYDIRDSNKKALPAGERGMSNCWSLKCINDDYVLGGGNK